MPTRAKFTVHKKDLAKGTKIEAKEHPGFSERSHRRIARQHLENYGPGYYRAEKFNEKVIDNINERMGAKPIRRKAPPRPGIFYSNPMDIRF